MTRRTLRRLVPLNVLLAAAAVLFGYEVARELSGPRPVPPPPVPRAVSAEKETPAPEPAAAARADGARGWASIAARNLFSPTRTETVADATPAAPASPKPYLMGVVLGGKSSRAYLEDPTSKRVFGYAEGDTVAGGRIESIKEDRVVIARPEGRIEVMLRDPAKPRPPAVSPSAAAAGPASARPTGGQPQVPVVRPLPVLPAPAVEAPMAPPRPLQSIPPDFLRRRGTVPGPATAPTPERDDE